MKSKVLQFVIALNHTKNVLDIICSFHCIFYFIKHVTLNKYFFKNTSLFF